MGSIRMSRWLLSVSCRICEKFLEFYDYEAKYHDGMARLEIPADLPPAMIARLQELAVKVFKALDCSGLARADFFIRKSG